MLKLYIDKLEDVEEPFRKLYVAKDGRFALDTDITEATEFKRLKASKDEILNEKKEEKKAREQLEKQKKEEELALLAKNQEYEKLVEETKNKFESELMIALNRENKYKNQLSQSLLDNSLTTIAATLAGENAGLLMPHLRNRVRIDDGENGLTIVVLNKDGQDSSMTIGELGEEFAQSPMYAPLIKGRGSSGGNSGGDTNASGGGESEWDEYFKPETRNMTKQIELLKKDRALYERLYKKYRIMPESMRVIR